MSKEIKVLESFADDFSKELGVECVLNSSGGSGAYAIAKKCNGSLSNITAARSAKELHCICMDMLAGIRIGKDLIRKGKKLTPDDYVVLILAAYNSGEENALEQYQGTKFAKLAQGLHGDDFIAECAKADFASGELLYKDLALNADFVIPVEDVVYFFEIEGKDLDFNGEFYHGDMPKLVKFSVKESDIVYAQSKLDDVVFRVDVMPNYFETNNEFSAIYERLSVDKYGVYLNFSNESGQDNYAYLVDLKNASYTQNA